MKHPATCCLTALLAATLLNATLLLGGCDSGKPDPIHRQTEILRVEVEPSPVPVGDTATFTGVIEDSTDERFEFTWTIEGEGQTITEDNTLRGLLMSKQDHIQV